MTIASTLLVIAVLFGAGLAGVTSVTRAGPATLTACGTNEQARMLYPLAPAFPSTGTPLDAAQGTYDSGISMAKTSLKDSFPGTCVGALGAKQVSVGPTDQCLLLTGGIVQCVGERSAASVAQGVDTRGDVLQLDAHGRSLCLLRTTGNVDCQWDTPWAYTGGDARALAGTDHVECILTLGGNVRCLSDGYPVPPNYDGGDALQISVGTWVDPRHVGGSFLVIGSAAPVRYGSSSERDASYPLLCVVQRSGNVWCASGGGGSLRVPPTITYAGGDAKGVTSAGAFTCVLVQSGSVRCAELAQWRFTCMPDGDFADYVCNDVHPFAGYGGSDAIAVASTQATRHYGAGRGGVCALLAGGTVTCWEWANGSPYRYGASSASYVPIDAVGISMGETEICILQLSGGATCQGAVPWGGFRSYVSLTPPV